MTFKKITTKLNWRQIILHFIASWFFIYAFQQLVYLTNVEKFDGMRILYYSGESKYLEYAKDKNWTAGELLTYNFYAGLAWIIGLIFAFIISLIIAKRRKWFWFNSLIVFIVVFVLKNHDWLGWAFLKSIFLKPGLLFHNTTLYLLTNGLVLLVFGVFVFLFKKFNDFIDRGNIVE